MCLNKESQINLSNNMIEINTKYFIDLFANVYDDTIGQ